MSSQSNPMAMGAPAMAGPKHDDLTEEEIAIIGRVEQEQQERKRKLFEKMQQEEQEKNARKVAGQQALDEWKKKREAEVSGRVKVNQQETEDYQNSEQRAKDAGNPWERVIDNCEMNPSQYVGSKDVTRMRQAMIGRKADITKRGGMKKAL